jgi:hypothetical protein
MLVPQTKPANRLLSDLGDADFALLAPHLRDVPLIQGVVLQEQEAPVENVYFPLSGVISLISVMEGGEVVETAMVGREGAVGAFGGLGPWKRLPAPLYSWRGSQRLFQCPGFRPRLAKAIASATWSCNAKRRC